MLIRTEIEAAFIGMQAAFLGHVFHNDTADRHLVGGRHMERANTAAALD